MKILMWADPTADKVMLRLRIHSGSAFDQQGKEGTMKMLAEALFPSETIREFFSEDLGGSLEIICNYDFIQINASSRPGEMISLMEALSQAISSPTFDNETTEFARGRVLEMLAEAETAPEYVAERFAAAHLLGTFPYGRPELGTAASLETIDFADLKFTYDRFLGADNATFAISGNYDPVLAYRAARRFFGSWRKSDRRVPSTFRRPDEPDTSLQIVASPVPEQTEYRFAVRGVARNEREYAAFTVLAAILENRMKAKASSPNGDNVFVRNDAHILPGIFMAGVSYSAVNDPSSDNGNIFLPTLAEKITNSEFTDAKNSIQMIRNAIDPVALWLDMDTYKLSSVKSESDLFSSLSLADVQKAADRVKAGPMVSVKAFTPKEGPDN